MFKKSRVWPLVTFAIVLVTLAPASAIFAGQGQTPKNLMVKNIIDVAQNANLQAKNLIDSVYSDEEAIQKITDSNLLAQLTGNISLYNQGVVLLNEAQAALENTEYEATMSKAREALQTFRQVIKSINWILVDAGLKTGQEIDSSSLLDAASRTLDRITRLRELLPSDATEPLALLDQAEVLLNLAGLENLILEGKTSDADNTLRQANELVNQVYQYLKLRAEESNAGRIYGYLQEMEQARERLRERFRYAGSLGMNMDEVFQSLGFNNETEFMNALQNMTQQAQGEMGNFSTVIGDLEALGQMVQQMNQTLTQEMNRHQMQHGSDGSGSGSQSPGTSGNLESGMGTPGYGSGAGTTSPGTGTTSGGNGYMNPETGIGSSAPSGTSGSDSGSGGNGP